MWYCGFVLYATKVWHWLCARLPQCVNLIYTTATKYSYEIKFKIERMYYIITKIRNRAQQQQQQQRFSFFRLYWNPFTVDFGPNSLFKATNIVNTWQLKENTELRQTIAKVTHLYYNIFWSIYYNWNIDHAEHSLCCHIEAMWEKNACRKMGKKYLYFFRFTLMATALRQHAIFFIRMWTDSPLAVCRIGSFDTWYGPQPLNTIAHLRYTLHSAIITVFKHSNNFVQSIFNFTNVVNTPLSKQQDFYTHKITNYNKRQRSSSIIGAWLTAFAIHVVWKTFLNGGGKRREVWKQWN